MEQRRSIYLVAILAAALLFGSGALYARWQGLAVPHTPQVVTPPPVVESLKDAGRDNKGEIQVHVVGAVERPGVYRMARGSRVLDAVTLAGPTPQADIHALNLAAVLADGQRVAVPAAGQTAGTVTAVATSGTGAGVTGPNLININTASAKELESLPGIGPALAQRIVDYRTTRGPFQDPADITGVSGIGQAKFEQIRNLITVY